MLKKVFLSTLVSVVFAFLLSSAHAEPIRIEATWYGHEAKGTHTANGDRFRPDDELFVAVSQNPVWKNRFRLHRRPKQPSAVLLQRVGGGPTVCAEVRDLMGTRTHALDLSRRTAQALSFNRGEIFRQGRVRLDAEAFPTLSACQLVLQERVDRSLTRLTEK